jgi:hypothetical protein
VRAGKQTFGSAPDQNVRHRYAGACECPSSIDSKLRFGPGWTRSESTRSGMRLGADTRHGLDGHPGELFGLAVAKEPP